MMRTQRTLTVAFTLLGYTGVYASDLCGVIEYPDRIEASCVGDPAPVQTPPEASPVPVAAPTVEAVQKEPAAAITLSGVPPVHSGFTEPDSRPPQSQAANSHQQQRRMAADIMENARAARLQKIMNSRP